MVKCFCCNKVIETEVNENPIIISATYDALIFRATGNYGSTVFDPQPSGREDLLQIIICDDCISERVRRVTRIHNIKRITTADEEPFGLDK